MVGTTEGDKALLSFQGVMAAKTRFSGENHLIQSIVPFKNTLVCDGIIFGTSNRGGTELEQKFLRKTKV